MARQENTMKDVGKIHERAVRVTRRRTLKRIVRAISIRQPYAAMIMRGTKRED